MRALFMNRTEMADNLEKQHTLEELESFKRLDIHAQVQDPKSAAILPMDTSIGSTHKGKNYLLYIYEYT